jgi:hypothetical protein
VDAPRAHKDLEVELTAGGASQTLAGDAVTGLAYGAVTVGDGGSIALVVRYGEVEIHVPAMSPPAEPLVAEVETEGDYDAPGALRARWTPLGDGSVVGTFIAINHHAGGPTFTECRVDGAAGSFSATAPMINPLAVSTGLEFQGVDHYQYAAAQTRAGCVDVRFGARVYVQPVPAN